MDILKAIVQKIIPKGDHGPYAVATSDRLDGSVTFSLEPTVWTEAEWPEEGMAVFLGNLRQKRAGWRAKMARFWKPSDEQQQQTERSNGMQFLYPTSRQYPFDEVCERMVRRLEERNWQVPGVTVEFDVYGSGEQKFRLVRYVKGQDFKIHFGREQRTMPGGVWNDTAAVTEIVIPQKELSIYADESGPTFCLYVGNDWQKDREKFMNSCKVNSKLNGEPRLYLKYKGSASRDGSYAYPNRRSQYLVHDHDLGREYSPQGQEPKLLITSDVMNEFTMWLEHNVLGYVMSQPVPTEKIDLFVPATPIPFPKMVILGELFCFGEYRDAERIKQGKADKNQLPASDRYGLIGNGYRLMSLDIKNDSTVPKIAYEGFEWCGIAPTLVKVLPSDLTIPGNHSRSRDQFLIHVKPNRANDIYIADHDAYEKRRRKLSGAMEKGRDRFTDAEVADFVCARGRTIVPIHEYKGGFVQPVVLINRELSFDEVEVIGGPYEDLG